MNLKTILKRIFIWQNKGNNLQKLIIALSIMVGVISGLAAVALKTLVHFMGVLVKWGFGAEASQENFLFLATPFIGILLTVLFLRYVIKDDISHGISKILHSISRRRGVIKPHNMYSSIVACTFTGGFGGSIGLEAPIVYTGSSIGSNIGQFLHLNYKSLTLLIGCGAAGAIAGIFKAPVAGVVFVFEVLLLDLTTASVIPLLLASVSGALVSTLMQGQQIEFYFTLKEPFEFRNFLFYIPLGLMCGFTSIYLSRMNNLIENRMKKITNLWKKAIIGGLALGVIIFIFPPLYGEGYSTMKLILGGNVTEIMNNSFFYELKDHSWMLLLFAVLVLLFKAIAMSVTTGSGGIGGIFAPTLYMGSIVGFTYSSTYNLISDSKRLSVSNFTLVGMAGLMAGTMHAPLTAIFLIAEITGSYGLFIPLIITASIAYITSRLIDPHSVYTKGLAKKGALITHNKDKAVLTLLKVGTVIEKDYIPVAADQTLGDLVKVVAHSKRNLFPVVDSENNLQGVVTLDAIRDIMFDREMYTTTFVRDVMVEPVGYVSSSETMESVMEQFNESGYWNLPVIDDGKYVGFVSRSNLFSAYRKLLVEFSED